jgi:capsular exopolysaccharide synthesis family protein
MQLANAPRVIRRANLLASDETIGGESGNVRRRQLIVSGCAGGGLGLGLLLVFATGGSNRTLGRRCRNVCSGKPPILSAMPAFHLTSSDDRSSHNQMQQRRVVDEFQRLCDNLVAPGTSTGIPHTLCITSPHRGDGRTTIAAGLAISLAKKGRKVLLIDADLRRPSLHRIFSVGGSYGLAELMEGKVNPDEAIHSTPTVNLDLIPAGKSSVDPEALLAWDGFRDYIRALGARYNSVIIDSPPFAAGPHSHSMPGTIKGVIFVADASAHGAGSTHSMEFFDRDRPAILGVVTNRFVSERN